MPMPTISSCCGRTPTYACSEPALRARRRSQRARTDGQMSRPQSEAQRGLQLQIRKEDAPIRRDCEPVHGQRVPQARRTRARRTTRAGASGKSISPGDHGPGRRTHSSSSARDRGPACRRCESCRRRHGRATWLTAKRRTRHAAHAVRAFGDTRSSMCGDRARTSSARPRRGARTPALPGVGRRARHRADVGAVARCDERELHRLSNRCSSGRGEQPEDGRSMRRPDPAARRSRRRRPAGPSSPGGRASRAAAPCGARTASDVEAVSNMSRYFALDHRPAVVPLEIRAAVAPSVAASARSASSASSAAANSRAFS